MKSLIKLIGRMSQGAMAGLGMNGNSGRGMKIKAAYEKHFTNNKVANSLSLNTMHLRNGSRGDGLGMGHENKRSRKQ